VLLLAVPVFLFLMNDWTRIEQVFLTTPVFAATGFLAGFIALAVARRVGFALLWLLFLTYWVGLLIEIPALLIGMIFVMWSLFAMPLYALGAIAFSTAGWRLEMVLVLGAWTVLSVLAMQPPELPPGVVDGNYDFLVASSWETPVSIACLLWPFVIVARELLRIVRAFRAPQETVLPSVEMA
jgi:hypothetical protein